MVGVTVSCILIRALNDQLEQIRFGSHIEYSYMEQEEAPVHLTYRL